MISVCSMSRQIRSAFYGRLTAIVCTVWMAASLLASAIESSSPHDLGRSQVVGASDPSPVQYSDTSDGESLYRYSQPTGKAQYRSRGTLSFVSERRLGFITSPRRDSLSEPTQPSLFALGIALRL